MSQNDPKTASCMMSLTKNPQTSIKKAVVGGWTTRLADLFACCLTPF